MKNFYLGLVHHPITNKQGEIVTTSVTNLDIHDISRSCRTFGFSRYFLITPIKAQQELVGRILGFWETDKSSEYNPDRHDALAVATIANSIQEAVEEITKLEGGVAPMVVVTGAKLDKQNRGIGTPEALLTQLRLDNRPLFLLFGTGHGLESSVIKSADFCLAPIVGSAQDGYNHLSVRSAVAIYCDRLTQAMNG